MEDQQDPVQDVGAAMVIVNPEWDLQQATGLFLLGSISAQYPFVLTNWYPEEGRPYC